MNNGCTTCVLGSRERTSTVCGTDTNRLGAAPLKTAPMPKYHSLSRQRFEHFLRSPEGFAPTKAPPTKRDEANQVC